MPPTTIPASVGSRHRIEFSPRTHFLVGFLGGLLFTPAVWLAHDWSKWLGTVVCFSECLFGAAWIVRMNRRSGLRYLPKLYGGFLLGFFGFVLTFFVVMCLLFYWAFGGWTNGPG